MSKITSSICAVIAFLLIIPLASCSKEAPSETTSKAPSKVFGSFSAYDINGASVTDEIFSQAELTLVNIWGSYCSPCIKEMPALAALSEEYRDKNVRIIGILSDASDAAGAQSQQVIDTARDIISKTGAEYTHIIPDTALVTNVLKNIRYIPTTVFVDKDGVQVGKPIVGPKTEEQWKIEIDSRLKEQK